MIWKRRTHMGWPREEKSRGGAGAILALGALALGGCAVPPPTGTDVTALSYPAYAPYPAYYPPYYPYYPYYGFAFFGVGSGFHRHFDHHHFDHRHFPHHHFTHNQFQHAHR